MCILITFFPFLGFLSGSLFGSFLGDKGVCFVTVINILISFIIAFIFLLQVIFFGDNYLLNLFEWICLDSLEIKWVFCFDSLTTVMLVVVTFISSLVHIYSVEYMAGDPHLPRFMSYLSLFTFFMLMLVTSNNFLQMFIGWEGVGVSSFLLINFWFTRIQANKAAIKAMLINRVGDFSLLIALFLIYYCFDSLNYDVVFSMVPFFYDYVVVIGGYTFYLIDSICFFLFFGAAGKSAQLGLHTWLPDAMEGPTPVSALIHAATMVTAGVFLICRCSFLFEFSPLVLNIVTVFGSLTALMASTTGLFQNDIKKIIAYSTCSQLGYMVIACGLSGYEVSMFHLSNHAFFKALLFLSAGSIIHALSDEQDMRKMGGLKNILPFSYAAVFIGSLALIGFPALAGFYSKDVILELSYSKHTVFSFFAYALGLFSAFVTAFYSSRLFYCVFLGVPNVNKTVLLNSHEGGWKINISLFLLVCLSIHVGYISKEFIIGFGSNFWGSSIFVLPQNYVSLDVEFIHFFPKLLPLILTVLGVIISYSLFRYKIFWFYILKKTWAFSIIYNFFNKKWFFDRIYNQLISQNLLYSSYYFFYVIIDRGLLEVFGPLNIISSTRSLSFNTLPMQSGYVLHYIISFIIIALIIILYTLNLNFVIFLFIIIYFIFNSKYIKYLF